MEASPLFQKYLPFLEPKETLNRIFVAAQNPDSLLDQWAKILEKNPAMAQWIQVLAREQLSQSKWKASEGNAPPLKNLAAMFGKSGIRNAIAIFHLYRVSGHGLPQKKEDRLEVRPAELLKYAHRAVEVCDEFRISGREQAYVAGFLFDAASLLLQAEVKLPGWEKKLEKVWHRSVRMAVMAHTLSKNLSVFPYHALSFSGTLCLKIGELFMEVLYPDSLGDAQSWSGFQKKMGPRAKYFPELLPVLERRQFQWTHSELSSLVVLYSRNLKSIEKSIRYYQEPHVLVHLDRDLFHLSLIFMLVDRLGGFRSGADLDADSSFLTATQKQWLAQIGILPKSFGKALAEVARFGGNL